MTYAARATRYARDVVDGKRLVGRLVRLACERHLKWLADPDLPYRWDKGAVGRVCGFIELLPHVKGKWATRHERIRLEDWQCFIVGVPFGWLRRDTGKRVFRRSYIEVARKNAKSTITAAIGLYMLTSDGETGAEIYSGAGTEKQAWEVFGPARLMAKGTPELLDDSGMEVNAKNLNVLETASKFEPVIGNPGDGPSPTFSITDEYHEHKTDGQYDTFVTGMGAREQPMAWVITTSGTDTAGPCYALRSEVVAMLEGTIPNDQLFGIVYSVDEDTDWTTREALEMANPNMGVSVFEDYLLAQQRDAVNNPRKQSTFKTKHLDVWVTAASPFFNLEKWLRLGDTSLDMADFSSEPVWIGMDLAAKIDLCAVLNLFEREEDDVKHFYVFTRFYIPEDRIEDPKLRHYRQWVTEGHLLTTPGNITDYDYIEDTILDDAEEFRVVQLGFDPWHATQIATHLMDGGIDCVEVPQTARNLSDPMQWIQALIEDGRIHHNGNPVMSWMVGNVTAQIDRNENVFPRKEQEQSKIDGMTALIIAKNRYLAQVETESIYETRELIVV